MALIDVGDAFDATEAHGEHGLDTFERLNLVLFIDTKDEGLVGRIEIEADLAEVVLPL